MKAQGRSPSLSLGHMRPCHWSRWICWAVPKRFFGQSGSFGHDVFRIFDSWIVVEGMQADIVGNGKKPEGIFG